MILRRKSHILKTWLFCSIAGASAFPYWSKHEVSIHHQRLPFSTRQGAEHVRQHLPAVYSTTTTKTLAFIHHRLRPVDGSSSHQARRTGALALLATRQKSEPSTPTRDDSTAGKTNSKKTHDSLRAATTSRSKSKRHPISRFEGEKPAKEKITVSQKVKRKTGISYSNTDRWGSRTKKAKATTTTAAAAATATTTSVWRMYGVEVHPDDLAVNESGERAMSTARNGPPSPESSGIGVQPSSMVGGETRRTKSFEEENDSSPTCDLHPAVLRSLYKRLRRRRDRRSGVAGADRDALCPDRGRLSHLPGILNVRIVRRSLDARLHKMRQDGSCGPRFMFVLDVEIEEGNRSLASWTTALHHRPGQLERLSVTTEEPKRDMDKKEPTRMNMGVKSTDDEKIVRGESRVVESLDERGNEKKPVVIIVGAGPAGLFCALSLARTGKVRPVVLERGQPVETRGRDIGALVHRRRMDPESNYAFGEGGAGTWSDGKLTTRIGRNSQLVRLVLETLVRYGAPNSILVDGAPHLGTDNLVRLLRNMRQDLRRLGGEILFGHKVTGLVLQNDTVTGVKYEIQPAFERHAPTPAKATTKTKDAGRESDVLKSERNGEQITGEAIVLATGHSARDVYEQLHHAGVQLEAKGFAVGFRVEHPQHIINQIQYGTEWGRTVVTGKSTTDNINQQYLDSLEPGSQSGHFLPKQHIGRLPVPSYRLATDAAFDGEKERGVYSFCMCPGGQIVQASTHCDELCVNGMSFSRRDSQWANSALVVTVGPDDDVLKPYRGEHGVLAGIAFQRDMERKAALMGGGNLTVPVQRLTDFVAQIPSTSAPASSYRLGVKPAACHEIYPAPLTTALRSALVEHFEKVMPGFLSDQGLLHAVETRTSSPVRVLRDDATKQALGIRGLFPTGEGAGFAGGIVSAAVDGLVVADAVNYALGNSNLATTTPNDSSRGQISTYY